KNSIQFAIQLPPLMSNLKIEEKTDDPPGRRQEEKEYAESVLGFLHESTVDFVKESCDTEEEHPDLTKLVTSLYNKLGMSFPFFCSFYLFIYYAASLDVGTTIRDKGAPRNREEFEASIPENPDDWTQEMWEYMYQKEQEDMRNFTEQLALQKQKQKQQQERLDRKFRRRRKIAKKRSKRERESSSGLA
ncbi:unnamed protein product, partial [Prunus brigantina]